MRGCAPSCCSPSRWLSRPGRTSVVWTPIGASPLGAKVDENIRGGTNYYGKDNEIVYDKPVPLGSRELRHVVVPANQRAAVIAELKAAGVTPPRGKSWDEFVLARR